jgi:peptidyl-prolyl cis-trans isomerase SurA
MMIRTLVTLLVAVAAFLSGGVAARAQGDLFTPAIFVNDRVITRFEIAQYRQFLTLLGQAGDLDQIAAERLIEDRLRLDAAAALGVAATPEQVAAGMTEFAGRANLTAEEFISALASNGVSEDIFRGFVEAGLLWREVVRARFLPRAQITEAEIDRALAAATRQAGARVLLSEIVLPANTPEATATSQATAARLAGQTLSEGAFAAEAGRISVSPSRAQGGRIDWLPLGNLPPAIAGQIVTLAPGEISAPFPAGNAIVLFQLRGLEETGVTERSALSVDWAEFAVASTDEALRLRDRVDTCDDLYGIARGLPPERLRRETRAIAQVPADVLSALARLDDNEADPAFSRGGQPVFLMLCSRRFDFPDGDAPSRDDVRERLITQRLSAFADGYLAELRADATIRYR